MRIGILAPSFPPNHDGVSISLGSLVEGLRLRGHETFVITPRGKGTYPDYIFPIASFPMPKSLSLELRLPYRGLMSGFSFFKKNKVDLIYSNDPFMTAPVGIAFSKLLGVPHIHSFHTHLEQYSYGNFPGYESVFRLVVSHILDRMDLVIAPTKKIERYLKSIGVQSKLTTLLNVPPVALVPSEKPDEKLRTKYGLARKDFVFVTFGRVAREKGLDTALRTFAQVASQVRNAKYLIAGHGPFTDELKEMARELGVGNRVIFTGKYDRMDLPALASIAHCFLFTSRTETQGITILEAMQCGLPVVSVDDDSVDYILRNGYDGYKCAERDLVFASVRVATNETLRERFVRNTISSAGKMDRERILDLWIKTFQKSIDFSHAVSK